MKTENSVLSPRSGGGPHGLGDPEDKSLRKVEMDVLIPKKMRDIAKTEKCVDEVKNFTECCKAYSLAMVLKCRDQNEKLINCLTRWYEDEDFKTRCKNEYLNERSEFRRTGITKRKMEYLKAQLKETDSTMEAK